MKDINREEKVLEELDKIIYFGNIEIPEELKKRYCRLIIELGNPGKTGYMHIYEKHLIDLDMLIQLIEDYYKDNENYNTKSLKKRCNYIRLFESFGLPRTIEELESGEIPKIFFNKIEIAMDSLRVNYVYEDSDNFIIYDLKKTEKGLELIDLNEVPIYAIFRFCKGVDFGTFSRYSIYHSCEGVDIKEWSKYSTVKEFADYVGRLNDADENKKLYQGILEQYNEYREKLRERYKPYLYEYNFIEQLNELANLSKEVGQYSPGRIIPIIDLNKIPSDNVS